MKNVNLLLLFISILVSSVSYGESAKEMCEKRYSKYEKTVEIAEGLKDYVITPIELSEALLKSFKKIRETYNTITVARTTVRDAQIALEAALAETAELEADVVFAPELEAPVAAVFVAEGIAADELEAANTVLGALEKPFNTFIKELTKVEPKLKFVAKEVVFATIFESLKEIIKIAENQCELNANSPQGECIQKHLEDAEGEISKNFNVTKKLMDKFLVVVKPLVNEQAKLDKDLSKFFKHIDSIKSKIGHFTHATSLLKKLKEKMHSKVSITLKWPSVTHPTRLAHKKVEFSVHGLLKNAKKEISGVVGFLGKEAKLAFHELIKLSGIGAFEKEMVGKAKKAIKATKDEAVKITKKYFPAIAKIAEDGKQAVEQLDKTLKLAKQLDGILLDSLQIPDPKKYSPAEIKRQCRVK